MYLKQNKNKYKYKNKPHRPTESHIKTCTIHIPSSITSITFQQKFVPILHHSKICHIPDLEKKPIFLHVQ